MKKKVIITIIALTILTLLICQIEQREVTNSKQLKEQIFKEIVNKLKPKDSIFIVTSRILDVCGNDDRYNSFTTPIEKFEEIKAIIKNPCFVDLGKDIKEEYRINNKIVITGEANNNEFKSSSLKFIYTELKKEKQVYDIQFTNVKKDTVCVYIFDYFKSETRNMKLKMVQKNSEWKIETSE